MKPKAESLNENGLTPLQQRFCEEYIVDLSATQAALRAGYSEATSYSIGHDNLKKPAIRAVIKAELEKLKERTFISQEWVIKSLINNYNRAMQLEPVLDKNGQPIGEYKYESAAANKAIELLGKHLQMFPDKVKAELSGPDGGPIQLKRAEDMPDEELAQLAARGLKMLESPKIIDDKLIMSQNAPELATLSEEKKGLS